MALFAFPSVIAAPAPATCGSWKAGLRGKRLQFQSSDYFRRSGSGRGLEVRAFFPNPTEQPILKEALKLEKYATLKLVC